MDQRSTNLKVSNLLDHVVSEVHKLAMGRMRADQAKAIGESPAMLSTIGRYLSTPDEGTRARLLYPLVVYSYKNVPK